MQATLSFERKNIAIFLNVLKISSFLTSHRLTNMFENDDWDIDENYLEDFNVGEDSNLKNQECEVPNASKPKSNSSKIEFNSNDKNSNSGVIVSQGADSCKNAILDIFKNVNSDQENFKSNATKTCNSVGNKSNDAERTSQLVTDTTSKTDISIRGKNVVLNVFQLNKSSVEKNDNLVAKTDIVKSALKSTEPSAESENKLKRKKNVAFSESVDNANSTKKVCISDSNDKPSTSFGIKNSLKGGNSLIKSPVKKNVKSSRMKQTVVREFPGPAGLLPDDVNDSEVIDLDSLDENKNNKNKYAEVCSQNTKNLFTTGAWQLMMDDLPADFDLHDIASVHQNALEYSRTFKKVPYLAGIIHKIDYKPNDPHIELKDLSGKIDARIHHSICKLYPNAFGTGIVILLKDVGLICTSKKYVCVIISPKSLVSIYSEEARLVETPHLAKLLDNCPNNLQESQISILDENEDCDSSKNSQASKSDLNHPKVAAEPKINIQAATDSSSKKNVNSEKHSIESENIDNVHDFDFNEDDSWLGVNVEDFNSFKAHQFPSSTPMDMIEKKEDKKGKETSVAKGNVRLINNKQNAPECREAFQCSENDTDDEILSQLDVDTIAASYNG